MNHPRAKTEMEERLLKAAEQLTDTVLAKNEAYGNSFGKTADFLRILYPYGIRPDQYGDALTLTRIFDKQMRVATRKEALGESPYLDIAGYGLLGMAKDGAAHVLSRTCKYCGRAITATVDDLWRHSGGVIECSPSRVTYASPLEASR